MKRKMMEAMEYMDQKYINEALEYKEKKVAFKPLLRWGAVAACLVLVVTLVLGFMGGLPGTTANEAIVLPPSRVGTVSDGKTLLAKGFTLQTALEEADAVAWIRIGNWLGEKTGDNTLDTSYFEAEVVRCYKGDLGQSIVLEQLGSSKWTIKGYPLFTHGNELLVFLKEGTGKNYDNCYWINGTYSTVMDVVTNDDGKVYVSDRLGMLGESISDYKINDQQISNLKTALCDVLANVDSVQQSCVNESEYVFTMETIEDLLTK